MSALTAPEIILRPVISEKSIDESQRGKYTFAVHEKANKIQIKAAVEELYKKENVTVISVNVLTTKAKKMLKGWAKLIIAQEFSEVSIDGYTGRHGRSEAYYKKLSTSRAKAVKNYLVNAIKGHGLSVKYTWAGHGSKHPIASNKTLAGSIKNQRVEVTLR